jgi:hypothetical protein
MATLNPPVTGPVITTTTASPTDTRTPPSVSYARAYQKGEYWEKDSNALIPGTRAWFEQKERESGDRR